MPADKRNDSTKQSDTGQRDRSRASERSEQSRFAENLPDGKGTAAEREYEDYVLAERDSDTEEPDVLLDVPVVKVDEINLDVEQLRARVSLQAHVLDLLRLDVGVDVFAGQVELEIKGVDAQALLNVRLDNVARILDRVLTTIDRNPQILEQINAGVLPPVKGVGGGAGKATGDLVESAERAVEEIGEGADSAVADTGEAARRTAQGAPRTVRQTAGGGGGKTAKPAKATARKDAVGRTAKRPASGGSRRVKRSNGQ